MENIRKFAPFENLASELWYCIVGFFHIFIENSAEVSLKSNGAGITLGQGDCLESPITFSLTL